MDRFQNAVRILKYGVIEGIVAFVCSFVSRTVLIHSLGVEYVGLNTLFVSVLGILNIAELGMGSAMVYYMYKAIADNDDDTICALFGYYRKCYCIIGVLILVIGILLTPGLNYLIEGEIPENINIYILYYINLINTSSTYFLFSYRSSLLTAYQRNDVLSKANIVLLILQMILQIVVLAFSRNYYLYTMLLFVTGPVKNVIIAVASKRIYPQYKVQGQLSNELEKDIRKKISALFTYKLSSVISGSADTIVISAFLGLTVLGYYNNYYYIITLLMTAFQVYYSSITAGIGNSVATESVEKNYKDFNKLFFIQSWLVGWSSICLLCLFQPFITIWVGEKMILPPKIVVVLVIYFYCWKVQDITHLYKEAAALWQYDKYATMLAALFNLIVNLVLVQFIGLLGVLISTLLACVLISLPWGTKVLFKYYFKKNSLAYYRNLLFYTVIIILNAICTSFICSYIKGDMIFVLLIRMIVCLVVPNVIFFLIYGRMEVFKEVKSLLLEKKVGGR